MRRGYPVGDVNILHIDIMELSIQSWFHEVELSREKLKGKRTNFSLMSWNIPTLGNRRKGKS